jgi:dTDP-4-dehydrorhamnose 3,5-epimerase
MFPDVFLFEPDVFLDERGYFMEAFNEKTLQKLGFSFKFVQDNHSFSNSSGVLRGLHYQLSEKAQTKLIRVIKGAIWDVVVDLRKGSPTFKKWEGFILSENNKRQLLVPKGFAHGFCTIVKETEVIYKVDEFYSPEFDRGICWNDDELQISWPVQKPILSVKDASLPPLREAENDFVWRSWP